ncbi:hypothetical protein RF11_06597 [Thelohanellus kitauei]|uniref:Uncharacterized protein n=1 Tax=Thelohanellus kitauei TaxID=669202 RepID=A0A0C2IH93_THEKT|nr:hypothetical protein RF11_06597 [Thelohanellus kitauei]
MYISIDTVHMVIVDIATDILDQMIQEMKSSTLSIFSIQYDESTDFENGPQILVYDRHIPHGVFKTSFSSVNVLKQLPRHLIFKYIYKIILILKKSIKSSGKDVSLDFKVWYNESSKTVGLKLCPG